MKKYHLLILVTAVLFNCRTEKKEKEAIKQKQTSVLEKIAKAHGYDNWDKVESIAFTFNVDRDSTHFERSWMWKPKTDEVTHINSSDTLTYNRRNMDSVAYKTNAGFINDRYWLLAPFNLIWDQDNFTYELTEGSVAPISEEPMQKLTIVYSSEGGYTPGDAYDFYFDSDHLIKEWVFRKGNQQEPSITTTWENYATIAGFNFVKDHKKTGEYFNLYIDIISVALQE
ncbi:MAG: hypothetical protein ACFB0A_02505 [Croceivirga sp.]